VGADIGAVDEVGADIGAVDEVGADIGAVDGRLALAGEGARAVG
jgi:hypothetical protein